MENIIMIAMKHLQINEIPTLNNPRGIDMPLNKSGKPQLNHLWKNNPRR